MKYPNKSEKYAARSQYTKRQVDKFIKWSLKQKGLLKYRELVEIQDYYNIKVY